MTAIYATTSDIFVLALTPVERWQAARRLDNTLPMQQLVYIIGAVVLLAMIVTYIHIVLKRRTQHDLEKEDNFVGQADRMGLSERESRILVYVGELAGLKDHGTVFTMKKAFDEGAQKLVREASSGMDTERVKQLAKELDWLREKLGFQERFSKSAAGGTTAANKPNSKEIPEGKTLYITRRTNRDVDDIEAIVVKNSDEGITVRLPMKVNSQPNEQWQVRYFYGASVWEFDVNVISNSGDTLVLGHSKNIRFINRRRFLRVPVNKKAYIAPFPFEKQFFSDSAVSSLSQGDMFESQLELPQFTPAVLIELAGPGLRVESSLELKIGQRVAVVFELESQHKHEMQGEHPSGKSVTTIVEGIGQVRHIKAVENGFSIAVELTGLSDTDINELIRATNVAAVEANGRDEKQDETSGVLQSAASVLTV